MSSGVRRNTTSASSRRETIVKPKTAAAVVFLSICYLAKTSRPAHPRATLRAATRWTRSSNRVTATTITLRLPMAWTPSRDGSRSSASTRKTMTAMAGPQPSPVPPHARRTLTAAITVPSMAKVRDETITTEAKSRETWAATAVAMVVVIRDVKSDVRELLMKTTFEVPSNERGPTNDDFLPIGDNEPSNGN